jgi:peptidoglycan/LPS O-acetylase OafA/YrhL
VGNFADKLLRADVGAWADRVFGRELSPVNKSRWAALAGLRFVLATCVVFDHIGFNDPAVLPYRLIPSGYTAVVCFLFISGYSIAASLDREREGYYRRRFVRIYPVYLIALFLAWATIKDSPKELLGCALMIQGITHIPAGLASIWSLSPEWWYYMVAPRLNRMRALVLGWVGVVVAYAIDQWVNAGGHVWFAPLWALIWPWMFGYAFYKSPKVWVLWAFALSTAFSVWYGDVLWTIAPLTVGATCLLMGSDYRIGPRAAKVLNYFGRVSYPLYLTHWIVFYWLQGHHWRVLFAGDLALAMVLERIEFWIQSWLKEKKPGSHGPPVSAGQRPIRIAKTLTTV